MPQTNYIPRANDYDRAMWASYRAVEKIQQEGGLMRCVYGSRREYDSPPWMTMPDNGVPFQKIGTVNLPPANGNDTLVLEFTVPLGFNGAISGVSHIYTGSGFVEGSGNLVWRIRTSTRWVKDMSNVIVQLGSMQTPYVLPRSSSFLRSGEIVQYYVNHAIGSTLSGGRIVCLLIGWLYPTA
jgi:hypothetical protein